MRLVLTWVMFIVAVSYGQHELAAIVIDDFTVAPFTLQGDFTDGSNERADQYDLDMNHVPFQRRLVSFWDAKPAFEQGSITVSVDASQIGTLEFDSTGMARAIPFNIQYGEPIGINGSIPDVDLLADGASALRVRFLYADFGPTADSRTFNIDLQTGQEARLTQAAQVNIPESSVPFEVVVPFDQFSNTPNYSTVNTITFKINLTSVETRFAIDSIDTIAMEIPGDFNGDQTVSGLDFLEWQRDTNIGLLSDWEASYGSNADHTASIAVPEPSGFVLVLAVLTLIAQCRGQ